MKKAAVIDVGTNSVRLLIAEKSSAGTYITLRYEVAITRLGEGIGREKILRPKAVERTLDVVKHYQEQANKLGAELVAVMGTSAVREAANKDTFINRVREDTNFELKVLSGSEEAELSCLGVLKSLPGLREEGFLIFDLGGGSTEFIWQTGGQVYLESLEMGVVRLTEIFISSDPPDPGEIKNMERHTRALLSGLTEKTAHLRKLIGVGGTVTSLAAVKQGLKEYNPEKVHGFTLTVEDIDLLFNSLMSLREAERKKLPGLQPQRADVIIAGTVIIKTIMNMFKFKEVTASE
ncbi:MAG: Ppx/GppA family phosphatase, partial [Firmicutes bacterium HGW-Firmicutes-13]